MILFVPLVIHKLSSSSEALTQKNDQYFSVVFLTIILVISLSLKIIIIEVTSLNWSFSEFVAAGSYLEILVMGRIT